MLDFGANPIERQMLLSAQFLHNELPVRLEHRVAELENLPFGLSAKAPVLKVSWHAQRTYRAYAYALYLGMQFILRCMQVRDWYVESFQELRDFKAIRDAESELKFTLLLRHIYHRHRFSITGLSRRTPFCMPV